MPYDSSKYMNKDGDIVHTRSGKKIKKWREVNKFTGEGEYVDVDHDVSTKEKKNLKLETLVDALRGLELDLSMTISFFENRVDSGEPNKAMKTLYKNLKTSMSNTKKVMIFVEKYGENSAGK